MFNTIVIENFFDNFVYLENNFKKIPLVKYDNYPQKYKVTATEKWPGHRSLPLQTEHPFLTQLVMKEIMQKSDSQNLIHLYFFHKLYYHLYQNILRLLVCL